ncbi:LysE family translocator [Sneathiella sp.]|uniref:LysE family translocator n=1 Tax=Sneathiella sp. TaxID=1964365 RepID=UPI002FE3C368
MLIEWGPFWLFVVSALALNLTPGPDMLFTTASGLKQGPRAGVTAALGISAGSMVHILLAIVGVTAIFKTSALAFDILRFAGAGYLLWIGIRSFSERAGDLSRPHVKPATMATVFRRGMLTNIFNPKVALFFIAFLPQFVSVSAGSIALQILILGLIFNLTGILCNGAVGLFSGGAGRLLLQRPSAAKWISRLSGTIFIGLAIRLAFMERA